MARKVHIGKCSNCGEENKKLMILSKSICKSCYNKYIQPKLKCIDCGTIRRVGKNTELGPLCDTCYKKNYDAPKINCFICGKLSKVHQRDENNNPICTNCYKYPKQLCCLCNKEKRINAWTDQGPVCVGCYNPPKTNCFHCGRLSKIISKNNGKPSCSKCYKAPEHKCSLCKKIGKVAKKYNDEFMCFSCYNPPRKICSVCKRVSPVTSYKQGSPICNSCYINIRRKEDEQYDVKCRLRVRLAEAFRTYSAGGKIKSSKEYGIDYEAIFRYIGPCPGDRLDYHIDHIKPLNSFDFNDPEQIKLAFAPENHQWLTKLENLHKSSKHRSITHD